jgi:small neutral amino acid transporter SnatA (MarC family)
MFLRFYAASLKRPWIKSPQSAFDDARYRFSVPLAAPFVALNAALSVVVRHTSPATVSARAAAVIICVSLVAAGLLVFLILGRLFSDWRKTPEIAAPFEQPMSKWELVVQIALWSCVVIYCVLMTAL